MLHKTKTPGRLPDKKTEREGRLRTARALKTYHPARAPASRPQSAGTAAALPAKPFPAQTRPEGKFRNLRGRGGRRIWACPGTAGNAL
ncbi:hypothetical protein DWUX_2152 [Desulfovibrio diazotrophicus]|nr:hypothetical protein DWUX_2152 [Desulfovibrio diazotrophicus]